jgi:peptidoglycan/LPS O-acetylase OafA/YrhL
MKSGLKPINPAASAWLDWIRALAAFAVFAGHLSCFCLENFSSQMGHVSVTTKAFYFVAGLGHPAVIVFFVLSGYLVGGSVLNEFLETGGLRFKNYLVARVARIHSVLIPALILGASADWVGMRLIHSTTVYEHAHFRYVLSWNVGDHLNLETFLANVACLQTILKPVFGSNGPLWSLANEFWYYFLFPALLLVIWPRTTGWRRISAALFSIALLWLLGANIDTYFLFWLAGVIIRLIPESRIMPGWLALLAFLGALAWSRFRLFHLNASLIDSLVTVGFSLLLLSVIQRPVTLWDWLANLGKKLAASSYTLYACHFPLAVLLSAMFIDLWHINMPGQIQELKSWVIYLGFILCIGGFCFGLSFLTERKHHQLKKWLARLVQA